MRDTIEITDADGKKTVIDHTPVTDFMRSIENAINEKNFFESMGDVSRVNAMDRDQLRYLAVQLAGELKRYAWLYDESFKPAHQKLVDKLRDLAAVAKKSGYDLWPELLEK